MFSQIRYVGMSRRCHPHEFWSVNLPLRVLVEGIMDAEVSSRIGAEYGERSPERVTQRNGYAGVSQSLQLSLYLGYPSCNGGPTDTIKVLPGSPAQNRGVPI